MIFVDSGAFLGRLIKRDQHHTSAVLGWKQLRRDVVTSNLVIAETLTLLGRWIDHEFAAAWGRDAMTLATWEVLRPDHGDEIEALEMFEKFADERIGFADCVSFALMRKHGIRQAFTFDRHFEDAGFERWPR